MFRTAETEKYAHVTYFFNGGIEPPYRGEERLLVPSQKGATYDLAPEMSAAGGTPPLFKAIAPKGPQLLPSQQPQRGMGGPSGGTAPAGGGPRNRPTPPPP